MYQNLKTWSLASILKHKTNCQNQEASPRKQLFQLMSLHSYEIKLPLQKTRTIFWGGKKLKYTYSQNICTIFKKKKQTFFCNSSIIIQHKKKYQTQMLVPFQIIILPFFSVNNSYFPSDMSTSSSFLSFFSPETNNSE